MASLALVAGCAVQHPGGELAQTPILWGTPAGGLQRGIAADVAAAPPGRPQGNVAPLESVTIYLRNQGNTDLTIVDPAVTDGASSQPAVITLFAGQQRTPIFTHARSSPARLIHLTPNESMSYPLPIAPGDASFPLIAQYENPDPQVVVGAPDGNRPPPMESGLWSGVARSGELTSDNGY
jgi:hypothetical protein